MSDFSQQPHEPPPVNPYDSPATARSGMSGGTKVLLGLGIGCGVLVLLCCGIFGVTTFYFGRSLQQAASEEPAKIREVTESIVSIEVPPALEPKMSLDWTMPFVNRKMMTMAVYGDKQDHSALVLFQLDEDLGDPEMMETQFRDAMRRGGSERKEVELAESETVKTEINGQEAGFIVGRGRGNGDREVWQAMGGFSGKGGPAMLFVQLNAEDFDKDELVEILESMK